MQLTKFGRTGISVSRLSLGTATFGKQTTRRNHKHIQYLGSTSVNLRERMDKYKNHQAKDSSKRPVHSKLAAELARGAAVEIYFLPSAPMSGRHGTAYR
jgi:hypothetical protein